MPPCTLHSCLSAPQHKRKSHQFHHNSDITNPLVSETRPRQAMWPCKKPVHVAASRLNRTYFYIQNRQPPGNRVKVLRPTSHKVGHFGDVLPSQYLAAVLNKSKTRLDQIGKNTQKANQKGSQQSTLRTAHVCVCVCVCVYHLCAQHNCRIRNTAQNSSDIFSLILRTNIIARMLSTRGEGDNCRLVQ